MGIFNDDMCIHNNNGVCTLNLSQLAWENKLLKEENEKLKKEIEELKKRSK